MVIRYARLFNVFLQTHKPMLLFCYIDLSQSQINSGRSHRFYFLFFTKFCTAIRLPPLFCIVRRRCSHIFCCSHKIEPQVESIWQNNSPLKEFIPYRKHHRQNNQRPNRNAKHNMNEITLQPENFFCCCLYKQ